MLRDPDLLPRVRKTVAHPGRLARARVYEHHVGCVYGSLEVVEPLLVLLARPGVARADVDPADDDPVLPRDDPLDLATLALLFARDHDDGIPALQFETHYYNTSGASEMILV